MVRILVKDVWSCEAAVLAIELLRIKEDIFKININPCSNTICSQAIFYFSGIRILLRMERNKKQR